MARPLGFTRHLAPTWRKQPWWFLLAAASILAAGAWRRFEAPPVPFFEPDSWGYLNPAISYLLGGEFEHTYGRSFVYPAFLLVTLLVGDGFEAVAFAQHLVGLAGGVLALAAWLRAAHLLPLDATLRTVHRLAGLVLLLLVVLSPRLITDESGIRPAALVPALLAVVLYAAVRYLELARMTSTAAARVTGLFAGLAIYATLLLYFVRPHFAFAIPVIVGWVTWVGVASRVPLRRVVRPVIVALGVGALTLWLPERQLAVRDPSAQRFLPATLFFWHLGAIAPIMAEDAADVHRTPEERAFLNRLLNLYAASQVSPPRWYATLGYNPDALLYGEAELLINRRFPRATDYKAFCYGYYARGLLFTPIGSALKIFRELALVYGPTGDVYAGAYEPNRAESSAESIRSMFPNYEQKLVRLPIGARYLRALHAERERAATQPYRRALPDRLYDPLHALARATFKLILVIVVAAAGIRAIVSRYDESPSGHRRFIAAAVLLAYAAALVMRDAIGVLPISGADGFFVRTVLSLLIQATGAIVVVRLLMKVRAADEAVIDTATGPPGFGSLLLLAYGMTLGVHLTISVVHTALPQYVALATVPALVAQLGSVVFVLFVYRTLAGRAAGESAATTGIRASLLERGNARGYDSLPPASSGLRGASVFR